MQHTIPGGFGRWVRPFSAQQLGNHHAGGAGLDRLEGATKLRGRLWFGIPGVDMADAAMAIQQDDRGAGLGALGLCPKLQQARQSKPAAGNAQIEEVASPHVFPLSGWGGISNGKRPPGRAAPAAIRLKWPSLHYHAHQ